MKKFSKLQRITNMAKYVFTGKGNIFIGDILIKGRRVSKKINMYGGFNIKYKALPGQYCRALTKDLAIMDQEVTHVSVHQKIPLYKLILSNTNPIYTSPLNSVIVIDGDSYRKVDIENEHVVGMEIPVADGKSKCTIQKVLYATTPITMYDISMDEHHTFMTDDGVFLYDTASVHIPITRKGIEDSMKLLPSRNIRWEATDEMLSGPNHAAASGLYLMSKTKDGRALINKALPKKYTIRSEKTKSEFWDLLKEVDKDPRYDIGPVVSKLRKMGDDKAYRDGLTVGLDDISPLTKTKDKVLADIDKKIDKMIGEDNLTNEGLNKIYKKSIKELTKEIGDYYKKNEGSLGTMLLAKSRGSDSQYRDIVGSPIAVSSDEVISTPIRHGYAEGLDPWEYWVAAEGARRGVIGRSQETALPGALGGELLETANRLVVGTDKSDTMKTVNFKVSQADELLDRYSSETIKDEDGETIIAKGEPITSRVLQALKRSNIKNVNAYTVLGSSLPDGSLPSMAYGVDKHGKSVKVGENLGVNAAHAIVDPLYSGSLSKFHHGGAMDAKESGFPRIKQLLEMHKHLPRQGTLSQASGKITKIEKDDIGGKRVYINDIEHYVSPFNKTIVKKNETVEKGDPISDGPMQPKEIYTLKSHRDSQNYLVDELQKNVPNARRRSLEVIVESLTRYGKVTDPGDSDYDYGDVDLINKIVDKGKGLKERPKFEPIFKGVNMLPQATQGWMSQMNFRHLKKQFRNNIAIGAEEDKHTYSPVIPLMEGKAFGKGNKGKY